MLPLWIIKLGSAVTRETDNADRDGLARDRLNALVDQCVSLQQNGVAQITLVSSGAVAAGRGVLSSSSDDAVTDRQVCAALGQTELVNFYRDSFARHGLLVAQVLAARQDFATRRHYLNMRACLRALLTRQIVPIINENDVVSVTELMFTDNDELAALVAGMLGAERLILLSDIDGVFDGDPAAGRRIPRWSNSQVLQSRPALARSSGLGFGRGGIASKVDNARQAAAMGTDSWIANGMQPEVLQQLAAGADIGTHFPAGERPSEAKRWVATAPTQKATIVINQGAVEALRNPDHLASLLPVGIVAVHGEFERGDVLRVVTEHDQTIAYGRAEYDSTQALSALGQQRQKPLVHYNYLHVIDHV